MSVEVNLKIPKGSLLALKNLADKRGDTIEETLRHAINTEVYMDDRISEGAQILCEDKNGKTWRVVFTHMTASE